MTTLRDWARSLKRQTLTLYYATRDSRTPWLPLAIAFALRLIPESNTSDCPIAAQSRASNR